MSHPATRKLAQQTSRCEEGGGGKRLVSNPGPKGPLKRLDAWCAHQPCKSCQRPWCARLAKCVVPLLPSPASRIIGSQGSAKMCPGTRGPASSVARASYRPQRGKLHKHPMFHHVSSRGIGRCGGIGEAAAPWGPGPAASVCLSSKSRASHLFTVSRKQRVCLFLSFFFSCLLRKGQLL